MHVPGLRRDLPDAVLVRSLSAGSFEAITLRLGFLHALREIGVVVWNDARAIERCVDKSMTSFLLAQAGIRSPATWITESRDAAREVVQREASRGPLVLKPLFGSQGRNLRLIKTATTSLIRAPSPGSIICNAFSGSNATAHFAIFASSCGRGA